MTPTLNGEKPKWPTNLKSYLVEQLTNYKNTGYFEGRKVPDNERSYYNNGSV